jgi:hypothetical protein
MPAHNPKIFKVTYAGRVEVDTSSLVYSKEGQRIMADAAKQIESPQKTREKTLAAGETK